MIYFRMNHHYEGFFVLFFFYCHRQVVYYPSVIGIWTWWDENSLEWSFHFTGGNTKGGDTETKIVVIVLTDHSLKIPLFEKDMKRNHNIVNHQENANQNQQEVTSHHKNNGCYQNDLRRWGRRDCLHFYW